MTTSFLTDDLIASGRGLHRAITDWGARHGVRAYLVLTSTAAWFEIYNPKTKTITRTFPPRIKHAIDRHKAALAAYAAWSRECDARWAADRTTLTPTGVGSASTHQPSLA